METIIKKEHITSLKDVTYYKTTDGEEFRQKEDAEKHEAFLKSINSFKQEINYKEVDLEHTNDWQPGSHNTSFTFELPNDNFFKIDGNINLFNNLATLHNNKKIDLSNLNKGKYLVIEYTDYDMSDYPSWGGYFGTTEDYLKWLESELNKAKSLLL